MVVAEREIQRTLYRQQRPIERHHIGRRQEKPRSNRKALCIVSLICIVILVFLPLYRFSIITESQYKIAGLQSKINDIESQNERLMVEIANLKSVARIEEIAKNKLNMDEPRIQQIIYLNVN